MAFERWSVATDTTWAFNLFNDHHAELNDLYWSYVPASQVAMRTAKQAASSQPAPDVPTAFALKGGQDRRMPRDLAAWTTLFKSFDNWVRLSALMSSVSYLELYMTTAITVALESDPGLLQGCSKRTDGVVYLKGNPSYTLAPLAERCTKGPWPSRVAAYKELFGHVPRGLTDAVAELDSIRELRNCVGHQFGRLRHPDGFRNQAKRTDMSRLAEVALQKNLAIVGGVAKAVDKHLGPSHIGAYEWIRFFHASRDQFNAINYPKELSRALGTARFTPGVRYCQGLVAYYDRT